MTFHSIASRKGRSHASRPREQRGVVLFIALIVMVALSLAGIALIRSTDTAGIVAGNLAFKQAAIAAVDRSVETAIHKMWDAPVQVVDKKTDMAAQNYFACVQAAGGGACIAPNSKIPEIPAVLASKAALIGAGLDPGLVLPDGAGNNVYYVIERMCLAAGEPLASNCNLSSAAFGANPGTQHYFGLIRPGDPYYRLTVRVEGPRNTVTYAQAILQ